jgi:uncharacterized repeat protein (TIGR03803 family)
MISLPRWKKILVVLLLGSTGSIASRAQTFKTLLTFDHTDGATPVDTPLVQGTNGDLYGTTLGGGSNESSGTVFKITPAGKLTTLYSFCSQANCADGSLPYGGLVLGGDGNFYGTTSQGGADGISGTVFRITSGGSLTTLHSFNGSDGAAPGAPMIWATNGNFYGITMNGGSLNAGTIFKITQNGVLTTLHIIGSGDGSFLNGPLVQGNDGNFYSTTESGGAYGFGTVFKVTPSGTFSTLHSFDSTDGSAPACGLVQASDGNFYGTTYQGGANNSCPNGCGTVFKMSPGGTLTTLHSFDSTEGANPIAALIQATDGNFYGTTYGGGTAGGWGTVLKITPTGTVTTLHSFDGNDGAQPFGPVAQATNGNLYGTATNGLGSAINGTLFEVSTGLGAFVSFIRSSGKIGQVADILGQGFTGTTSVSFHGTPAQFTVKSDTFITATVPAGATTGFVKVATPGGTLTSNVRFRVVP